MPSCSTARHVEANASTCSTAVRSVSQCSTCISRNVGLGKLLAYGLRQRRMIGTM